MKKLHVLAVISNPVGFESRYILYEQFKQYIEKELDAELYTAELVYPEQDFKVTSPHNPRHLQLHGNHEIWHKENMLNLLVERLPEDWEYVAWIDADVIFARQDWAKATIEQLQKYDVVQMFSECRDLTPNYETIPKAVYKGIAQQYHNNPNFALSDSAYSRRTGHTGYAWACTRHAWEQMGGLLDFSIMGSADYQMACAFFGDALASTYGGSYSPGYCHAIKKWGDKVSGLSVGYVEGLILHNYHGKKSDRGYMWRWRVLAAYQYDPYEDIKFEQGVLVLNESSPKFEIFKEQLERYFRSRNEDEHLG